MCPEGSRGRVSFRTMWSSGITPALPAMSRGHTWGAQVWTEDSGCHQCCWAFSGGTGLPTGCSALHVVPRTRAGRPGHILVWVPGVNSPHGPEDTCPPAQVCLHLSLQGWIELASWGACPHVRPGDSLACFPLPLGLGSRDPHPSAGKCRGQSFHQGRGWLEVAE